MISAATTEAIAVVYGRFTSSPMTSARRVSRIIGTSANGMPKDSTTWEMTSVEDGSSPRASTTSAGAMVIARRRNSLIRRSMKPCMTTWPANVPTLELDSPEASSATAKASAAPPPSSCSMPAWAPWIESTPERPAPGGVGRAEARGGQRRVQVDDVRHDRRAEDADGQQDAVAPREVRHEPVGGGARGEPHVGQVVGETE